MMTKPDFIEAMTKAMVDFRYGENTYSGAQMQGAPSPGCDMLIAYRQLAGAAYSVFEEVKGE